MRSMSCAVLFAIVLSGCNKEPEAATEPSAPLSAPPVRTGYQVVKYPSLGGTLSRGMAINKQGLVAGWSNQADGTRRAVLRRGNSITSLGTLGGPHSSVPWQGLNDDRMVVGISHTAEVDSLDEFWACELGGFLPAASNLVCRGFVWQNNTMRELPTLGGTHGFATGVNNLGQIVGWAETPVHDSTCVAPQVLQFRAVLWTPGKNQIDKPPFPGESTQRRCRRILQPGRTG